MHSSVGINHYAVFYADTHFMPPEAKRKGYRLPGAYTLTRVAPIAKHLAAL